MSWETPDTYHSGGCQAGDRHLNFHDDRDNLHTAHGGLPPASRVTNPSGQNI